MPEACASRMQTWFVTYDEEIRFGGANDEKFLQGNACIHHLHCCLAIQLPAVSIQLRQTDTFITLRAAQLPLVVAIVLLANDACIRFFPPESPMQQHIGHAHSHDNAATRTSAWR